MKNNRYHSHSRRKTPWDEEEEVSDVASFVRDEYRSHYFYHHRPLSETGDSKLLNKFIPQSCPYCHGKKYKRNGHTTYGLQKYKCSDCKRNFTITTGTIFQDHKLSISEWIEYLLNLFGYSSINLNSKMNKNSETTSKYWLAKIFMLLSDYQEDIVLSDCVMIDKTYYSVIKSDIITKDKKKLRGLSKNKYCIGIGCDEQYLYCKLEGKAKTSDTKTLQIFKEHIRPYSHLIHDDEKSHHVLVQALHLKSESYKSTYLSELNDKDNPLDKINHYCDLLKKFLNAHLGFNREELQGYLNLFSFMLNPPHNKLEKVEILLKFALNYRKTMTFRGYYMKNPY